MPRAPISIPASKKRWESSLRLLRRQLTRLLKWVRELLIADVVSPTLPGVHRGERGFCEFAAFDGLNNRLEWE
ncbi:hypothetical protein ETAA8_48250 [Anatilimnocola aggregata]|uniref:Uncharacterized protein n=1 Tax=Anatilimnocola aggregata TaxID=2528021 RepID=A0A517YHJ8_9BACT|nr:hypothetical protein ETAA8_48250 [Anatilimnocola aggregata]